MTVVLEVIGITIAAIALVASFMLPMGVAIGYCVKHISHYQSCCGCLHIDTRGSSKDLKEVVCEN